LCFYQFKIKLQAGICLSIGSVIWKTNFLLSWGEGDLTHILSKTKPEIEPWMNGVLLPTPTSILSLVTCLILQVTLPFLDFLKILHPSLLPFCLLSTPVCAIHLLKVFTTKNVPPPWPFHCAQHKN
jgi:hypothetical protein